MPPRINQPTKEQVRAYMLAREAARHPPPPPEEIRRQLGWRVAPDDDPHFLRLYLIPSTCGQLAARLAVDWMYSAVPVLRKNCQ
jgi:hypothetical protein